MPVSVEPFVVSFFPLTDVYLPFTLGEIPLKVFQGLGVGILHGSQLLDRPLFIHQSA